MVKNEPYLGDFSYFFSHWHVKKSFFIYAFAYFVETFILFKGNDGGVSNVVRDAYQHYEDMEFGSETRTVNDPERHIKLISMTGKKVQQRKAKLLLIYIE